MPLFVRRSGKSFFSFALLAASSCGPGVPAATSGANGSPTASRDVRDVKVARVRDEPWSRTLRATGELAPFEAATLSAKVAGRLESIAVDLGTRVKAGDPIARIEARDYELKIAQSLAAVQAARARLGLAASDGSGASDDVDPETTAVVRSARAELDDARRENDRVQGLAKQGIASQSDLDGANWRRIGAESKLQEALEEVENRRATLAQRRAELEIARQQLADTAIVAPFDGAVALRLADRGEFLAIGSSIARLVRFDPVRLRLRVPESAATGVALDQPVAMRIEGDARAHEGRLVRVSPEVDPRSRTLLVEAEFANADGSLRPGSFASADLIVDAAATAHVVPGTALVRFAGVDRVFVANGGEATERRVTVGRIEAERVEILEGVAAGEQVILEPGSLRTGAKIRATD